VKGGEEREQDLDAVPGRQTMRGVMKRQKIKNKTSPAGTSLLVAPFLYLYINSDELS
jgi:hypothetical protein